MIEEFGLERTFKGHPAKHPCSKYIHLQLDQVAQAPLQPDFERVQGWGIYHLSGQPVPEFRHCHCKKFPHYTQSKSTFF